MSETELFELAALDAAGALDQTARRDYERRLALASPDERAAIAELYDGAAALAESMPGDAPAPAVKDRLISAMGSAGRLVSVRAGEGEWRSLGIPGVVARTLHLDAERQIATLHVRVTGPTSYPPHHHHGPEDTYVLSGEVIIQGQRLRQGDFHHADAGSDHGPITCEHACELLLIMDAADFVGA